MTTAGTTAPPATMMADFSAKKASREIEQIGCWAVRTSDQRALAFALIDKINARLYAFDARGGLLGVTAVLIGIDIGDSFAPRVRQTDM